MTETAKANVGAKLVRPRQPFDEARLAEYLRGRGLRCEAPLVVEQFQGGQSNPTYRVTAGDARYVLRRKPPGKLLPSAHAVDREHRVMSALRATDVPVPKMLALCEDESVIGTAFYVMEHVEGRILWDPSLPGMTPAERGAHYDALGGVLASLHRVDPVAVGLADYGKAGQYVERQVARWSKQYAGAADAGAPRLAAMDKLIAWLPAHVPPSDAAAIVHGDYRLDNVIWHPTEPRILAVLDWELSTLGHPLSDFAYHAMIYRLTPSEFRGIAGLDLSALGIPDESAYVRAYERRTGVARIPDRDWTFYLAFNMFRLAAILHGVFARALQGNAADANARDMGSRAEALAELAWSLKERMD